MPMADFQNHADRTLELLAITPGWAKLQQIRPDCDDATAAAIVEEAAAFAEGIIAPLNVVADREGCAVVNGRVVTPDVYKAAFRQYTDAGWLGMDIDEAYGGMNLPLTLQAVCGTFFERGCVALMMALGASRAAAHLLAEVAEPVIAEEWVSNLVAGHWSATICISEPEAGSDVGRLRTVARRGQDGWRITGQKIWISFGDHDLTERIGHCLLARTSNQPGTRGLSLFLVPDRHADGLRNGVTLERIEEKMGLHGSPTCALRFEAAQAILLGEEGRGLPQLFAMIERMRLQTGGQGLGLATAACDIAEAYALDRRQGGAPDKPPVAISTHPDIQRQLAQMRGRTEIVRAALLEIATTMDLARHAPSGPARHALESVSGFLLPLFKNFGAEAGFSIPNAAIQVLGGVGYTKDWPLEQYMRDARVMTIYEGTTGIQAIDLLTRRIWRDQSVGLALCLERAWEEVSTAADTHREIGLAAIAQVKELAHHMDAMKVDPEAGLARADSFMRAIWSFISIWMAVRLTRSAAARSAAEAMLPVLAAELTMYATLCR